MPSGPFELNRRMALAGVLALGASQAWTAERPSRLVLLGTGGGPTPKAARSAPASAIVVGGSVYVIDCGNGVARQMVLAGLSLKTQKFFLYCSAGKNAFCRQDCRRFCRLLSPFP